MTSQLQHASQPCCKRQSPDSRQAPHTLNPHMPPTARSSAHPTTTGLLSTFSNLSATTIRNSSKSLGWLLAAAATERRAAVDGRGAGRRGTLTGRGRRAVVQGGGGRLARELDPAIRPTDRVCGAMPGLGQRTTPAIVCAVCSEHSNGAHQRAAGAGRPPEGVPGGPPPAAGP